MITYQFASGHTVSRHIIAHIVTAQTQSSCEYTNRLQE